LNCQLHTDYTVSAHDILIFETNSVVFVKCADNDQQLYMFTFKVYHTVDSD